MDTSTRPVVVAVGPSGSGTALRYAAAEARRRRAPLHLVHGADVRDLRGDRRVHGPDLLTAALGDAVVLVEGEVAVTAELILDGPVPAVAEASRQAAVVVVGRRRGRPVHPYARSVTGGLGGLLEAPVVTVPDEWPGSSHVAPVVVGIDEPDRSQDVLVTALEAARAHRTELVVLSSWWRPLGAERTPLTLVTDPTRAERLGRELEHALDPLRPAYDDVSVEVRTGSARPGEALLEASQGAALMVLGRHASLVPAGSHLGPVARAVVREAACPVLLAAPGQHHGVLAHA